MSDCYTFVLHIYHSCSIVTDIIKSKLETAKIMGADVVVNGTQQNLAEVGKQWNMHISCYHVHMCDV